MKTCPWLQMFYLIVYLVDDFMVGLKLEQCDWKHTEKRLMIIFFVNGADNQLDINNMQIECAGIFDCSYRNTIC